MYLILPVPVVLLLKAFLHQLSGGEEGKEGKGRERERERERKRKRGREGRKKKKKKREKERKKREKRKQVKFKIQKHPKKPLLPIFFFSFLSIYLYIQTFPQLSAGKTTRTTSTLLNVEGATTAPATQGVGLVVPFTKRLSSLSLLLLLLFVVVCCCCLLLLLLYCCYCFFLGGWGGEGGVRWGGVGVGGKGGGRLPWCCGCTLGEEKEKKKKKEGVTSG